ncbi:MAG TPA: alpha/beta hydrolase domain-containing protein, partial [Vicinamibacterales bacterium]|nr:alpha/beta hydrolase domain-containing protein [Vicinamibacterales bacterium]
MRALSPIGLALVLVVARVGALSAEVVRVDVQSRSDIAGGQSFGTAGAFERLSGRIYFAVDPTLPANRIITDIDKAPRNAAGKVEFSSDFFLIKPKQIARGNAAVLYEVSNRGGKGMLGFFDHASGGADPTTAEQMGDGFLLKQGFSLLWVGWQFDVPKRAGLVRVYPPTATDNGKPIRGLVRSDFVVTEKETDHSLADRDHTAYAVVDPNAPDNVMTVRDSVDGPRRIVPRDQWRFARSENGALVPDPTRVTVVGKFEPGKIYEVVYAAENPPLVGLGPAAIRDTIAFLKHQPADAVSIPSGAITRAIGFGISQSGRFLRTYLYYGFNRDEANRKVFDGVIAHVAGAGRGSFNHRFAQPSRDGHPYLNFFYPTDIFPFTDVPQTDPQTGATDGLLTHAGSPDLLPKVFYTNSEYEYWGRAASLIHTTVDGTSDAPLMDNVRIYLLTAGQHGPAAFPPTASIGQQKNNPLDYRWAMKALLVSMDRWIASGTPPPPSKYPRIADGTLVAADKLKFPRVSGVTTSTAVHKAYRADYGPRFATEGVVTIEPPKIGRAFPILVPQVDADGNGVAGIRMPELSVPLATYTGWNLFNERSGPTEALSSMQGSYIPLAKTAPDRKRANDPRPSIDERYRDKDQYVGQVTKAALELIDQGYLLAEDLAPVVRNAGKHWDYATTAAA